VGRKGAGGVLSWTASTWHKSLVVTRQADPFVWHSFSRLFPYFLPYLLMMQSLVGFLGGEKKKRIWCIFELNLASPPLPVFFPFFTACIPQHLLNINTPPALFSLQLEHEYWLPACLSTMGTEHPAQRTQQSSQPP